MVSGFPAPILKFGQLYILDQSFHAIPGEAFHVIPD